MIFPFKYVLSAVIFAAILGGVGLALQRVYNTGYNTATTAYELRIAQMRDENRKALDEAATELKFRTEELKAQLDQSNNQLQEILNDQYEDQGNACGIPERSLRLLDSIR